MLKILRDIVQDVNAEEALPDALKIMVTRIKETFKTQACTIYLADSQRAEFILMVTEGLNPAAEGKIRLSVENGLVGLVARREEPINVEDAPSHPDFYYHPVAGEETYSAFLGVPIIHHRRIYGVLTVQQEEKRKYDESEEAFLVTIAAQLAISIAHADSTGLLSEYVNHADSAHVDEKSISGKTMDPTSISGIPSVPGVGIGQAQIVYPSANLEAVPKKYIEDIDAEIATFRQALLSARQDVIKLKERLETTLPAQELALFDVYTKMLEQSSLGEEIIAQIKKGKWAQYALKKVIKKYIRSFNNLEDEYLRERASDFRDLGHRNI